MKPNIFSVLVLSLNFAGCTLPSGSIELSENHPANNKAGSSPLPKAKAELMADRKVDQPAPAPEHEVEHNHEKEAK